MIQNLVWATAYSTVAIRSLSAFSSTVDSCERGGGRDEPVHHHRSRQRTVASRDLSCKKIPFPMALNEPYPVYGLFR